MKRIVFIILTFINLYANDLNVLKIHCGATMVHAIKDMSKIFERENNCTVIIKSGGSQDLYDSLKFLKNIDLYLPGSPSYLEKNKKDGFFKKSVYIGYNQAVILVKKGNPKNITSLDSLTDKNIKTILCDPLSGSIGKMSKEILIKYKGEEFFKKAYAMTKLIAIDSRDIKEAFRKKEVDMAINWKASIYSCGIQKCVQAVAIDKKYAPRKKLMLTLLTFSKNQDLAKKFMEFATSERGKKIMKNSGFL